MVEKKEKQGFKAMFKRILASRLAAGIAAALAALLLLVIVGLGIRSVVLSESKSTKLGFENIGELSTQTAYCTSVNVTEGSRELFGVTIPFTQSKYIYSYDIVIKAGFDFTEIEWEIKDTAITVRLPEAKILSSELKWDSFKLYHEDESIFKQIKMEENNEALKNLVQNAETDAVANGLLDNARSNAETILRGFFGNVYNLEEYEIRFINK